MFGALRNRDFRLLWLGSVSAFVGFFTANVVQAVVAFDLTHQNRAPGLVVLGRGLAQLLLAPLGGVLADRLSKRAILVSSQGVASLVFFGLAWLMWSGQMQIAHLTAGSFLVGMTFAFLGPTRSAYVVELVEPDRRGNAIALNQVALSLSRVAGPALSGLLLGWAACGATGAFVAMGAMYGGALVLQARLPPARPADEVSQRGVLADLADGVAYVRRNPRLRALLAMFVLTVMVGFPYVTLLPGFVRNQLSLPARTVSVLFSASAAGGLISSLLAARLADSAHALRVYRAAGIGMGLCLMSMLTAHGLATACALLFMLGFCSSAFTALNGAVLLRYVEARYVGRVMSIAMLAFGAFGLLGFPVGVLADALGEGVAMAMMGALVCLVVTVQGLALGRAAEAALAAEQPQPQAPP